MHDNTKEVLDWNANTYKAKHERDFVKTITEMLGSLRNEILYNGMTQLEHSLQTATKAFRANASDEMILCALCHDMAHAIGQKNHGPVAAEILKPFISQNCYFSVYHHEVFQGYFVYDLVGLDKNERDKFKNEDWYQDAMKLHVWDSLAFDLSYKSKPLFDFEDLLHQFLGKYPGRSFEANRQKLKLTG